MSARSRWPGAARWAWLDAKEAREAARHQPPVHIDAETFANPQITQIVEELRRLERQGNLQMVLQVHRLLFPLTSFKILPPPEPPTPKYDDDIPF